MNIVSIALLLISVFLVLKHPLRRFGIPRSFELLAVTLFILIIFFHVVANYLLPAIREEEMGDRACAPQTLQMRCYTVAADDCETVWDTYYAQCKKELRENVDPKKLSALIGPQIKKCTEKRFDQSLKAMRRTPVNSECEQFFMRLDALSVD